MSSRIITRRRRGYFEHWCASKAILKWKIVPFSDELLWFPVLWGYLSDLFIQHILLANIFHAFSSRVINTSPYVVKASMVCTVDRRRMYLALCGILCMLESNASRRAQQRTDSVAVESLVVG